MATPLTMPDVALTVASDILLLLHEPPEVELASVMVLLTQTALGPVFAESGLVFIVSVFTAAQPLFV
jgi:hypothetical protein